MPLRSRTECGVRCTVVALAIVGSVACGSPTDAEPSWAHAYLLRPDSTIRFEGTGSFILRPRTAQFQPEFFIGSGGVAGFVGDTLHIERLPPLGMKMQELVSVLPAPGPYPIGCLPCGTAPDGNPVGFRARFTRRLWGGTTITYGALSGEMHIHASSEQRVSGSFYFETGHDPPIKMTGSFSLRRGPDIDR